MRDTVAAMRTTSLNAGTTTLARTDPGASGRGARSWMDRRTTLSSTAR